MTGPIDDAVRVGDGQVPDVLDEIVAETRDYTPEQCSARLAELSRFTRLSGRQRVEQSLLAERAETASRVMTAYASGNTGMFDQSRPAPGGTLAGGEAGHGGWANFPASAGPDRHLQQHRMNAMRVLDHYRGTGALDPASADRADAVLRHGDGQGLTARYIAACGNPDYFTAFGKMLGDPVMGHNRFTPAETAAMTEMSAAQDAVRIMGSVGTTSTGFPLPLTVDPSIVITGTGAGALNPVRDVADVVTIGTHDWVGVTADSVTAHYVQEGTEATDDTPALIGPRISSQQGRAFVPFTIEAGQDWDTLSNQLQKLIADAKNTLDATKFLLGSGTNEPSGILNIGALNGLTTTQRVQTLTVATYAVGDPWLLKAAIPPRFIGDCTFAAAPATWDTTYQFVAQGSTTAARQFSDGDRGGDFLGRPKLEWSTMATGSTTGTKLIIGGNFKGYKIVDRLAGITVEVIPHLFSTANARPIGTRGLYAYWRCGAGVISPNHFRYLEVKLWRRRAGTPLRPWAGRPSRSRRWCAPSAGPWSPTRRRTTGSTASRRRGGPPARRKSHERDGGARPDGRAAGGAPGRGRRARRAGPGRRGDGRGVRVRAGAAGGPGRRQAPLRGGAQLRGLPPGALVGSPGGCGRLACPRALGRAGRPATNHPRRG